VKVRFFVALGTVVLAGGGLIAATTSSAGAAIETTFISHTTNVEFVTASGASLTPPAAFVPGDRVIVRNDDSQGSTVTGHDEDVCTVMFNDDIMCEGVAAVTNVGDISFTFLERGGALPNPPSVYDGAINGGTFGYRNAHGSFHAVVQPNGDTQVTVAFVTTG
jgi:hypothetical protein